MASDFSAKQIRVSQLMASGGISGTDAGLLIYSASDASDYIGGFPADLVANFGNDVFLFVSGAKDGRSTGAGNVTLFGGDIVVSGTLYAEKQVVEVNESTTGSFAVSGSFFVSQSATINQGLVVNQEGGIHTEDDFRVETGNKTHALFVDASTDQILILSGGGGGSTDEAAFADMNLFVSGTVGSRGTAVRGTALFGGDVHISGAITSDGTALVDGSGAANRVAYWSDIDTLTSDTDFTWDGSTFTANGAMVIDTSTFVVDSSNNRVGIGTATPGALGHLYKAATGGSATPLEILRLELGDEGVDMSAGQGPAITFYVGETGGSDHGGTVAVVREIEGDADSASAMVFHTAIDDTTPAERMRITSAGKVGIGTSSPTGVVDVKGDGSTSQIFLLSGSGAATDPNESDYADMAFFVSGAVGSRGTTTKGTAVFGGDTVVSGALYLDEIPAPGTIPDGTIAVYGKDDSGVTKLYFKNESGEVELGAGGAPGGSDTQLQYNNATAFGGISGATTDGSVVTFGDTGILVGQYITHDGDPNTQIRFETDEIRLEAGGVDYIKIKASETAITLNPDNAVINTLIYSQNKTGIAVAGATDQVLILSGGGVNSYDEAKAADVNFYVSGTVGSAGTAIRGTSVFGGDVVISGSLYGGSPLAIGDGLTVDGSTVFNEVGSATSDFRIESDNQMYMFQIDSSADRIGIGTNTFTSDVILDIRGDVATSGYISASMGFSGSLTRLVDDTSYLVAGSNVTITSASNGQVTIASTGGSGSPAGADTQIQYNNAGSFGAIAAFTWNDTDLTIDSATRLLFRDAGLEILSPHDGELSVHADAVLSLTGSGAAVNAVAIIANNAAGGIDVDAGTGGVAIDSTGAVSIDSTYNNAGAINITADGGTSEVVKINSIKGTSVTEGAASVQLLSQVGGVGIKSTANLAGSVRVTADGGVNETIIVHADQSTVDGAAAAGAIQLISDAGGIGLSWADNKDLWAEGGRAVITANENAAAAIKLHADAGANQTIIVQNDAGSVDGADGTGAILLAADAGGIGLAWNDGKDLWAEGGRAIIVANENASEAIRLQAGGGVDSTILVRCATGTGADAVELKATVGGILLNVDEADKKIHLDSEGSIDVDSGTGGYNNTSTGKLHLSSSLNSGDGSAIAILASAGGIAIDAVGAAGEDITIVNTGGSVKISATENSAEAIEILAIPGGVTITAGDTVSGVQLATGVTGVPITIGHTTSETTVQDNLNVTGDLLPSADVTSDLGSTTKRWQNIYTGDLHLANERGDWSVIEESDYLTLRNNKSGKRYKLLMELLPDEGEE